MNPEDAYAEIGALPPTKPLRAVDAGEALQPAGHPPVSASAPGPLRPAPIFEPLTPQIARNWLALIAVALITLAALAWVAGVWPT